MEDGSIDGENIMKTHLFLLLAVAGAAISAIGAEVKLLNVS